MFMDPAQWWATYHDQDAGYDRPSLHGMAERAAKLIGDTDAVRALMTPAEIEESGWDAAFGGARDAWERTRGEILARLAAITSGDPRKIVRRQVAALGSPGELLTMGDGSKWFHAYTGAGPVQITQANVSAVRVATPDPMHNPDTNPDWTPSVKMRVYACAACGAESTVQTNHSGSLPMERCAGRCRQITNPHTAHERVGPFYGRHIFMREA